MSQSMLYYNSRKKSAFLALFLNLVFPGAGYFYCGAWLLGICWLLVGPCLAIAGVILLLLSAVPAGLGLVAAAIILHPVSIIHVVRVANAYNRRLAEDLAQQLHPPSAEHLHTDLDMP